jgi:hypothetical protein
MVLQVANFRLHPSLRKTLKKFRKTPGCEVRIDTAFEQVMRHCAQTVRPGQDGTWIVDRIVAAYTALHRQGKAHSVETWIDGQLVGGLYCVALGRAVFGESMFAHASDASKIALAALVACAATRAPRRSIASRPRATWRRWGRMRSPQPVPDRGRAAAQAAGYGLAVSFRILGCHLVVLC